MELSDSELVQRCREGETDAFQELVSRHYHRVYGLVLGMLNHPDDAMDVAQEAFFRAYRKLSGFEGGSSFYTWIYRIAVNLAIDFQRHKKRNPMEVRDPLETLEEYSDEEALGGDPGRKLQHKQLGERLLAAIDDLTPDHKAVILLRAMEGLSYKEIGRILRCSEGTVMSRLHYARKRLLEKLDSVL